MNNLKINRATYYDPQMGVDRGVDVTEELSAEIIDNKLFYKGIYNLIFPDLFAGKQKRLKVEIEYLGKKFTKFYNENEKINLPHDLGEISGDNTSDKGRVAVSVTESEGNNFFINSRIRGGVELADDGNSFIGTTIDTLRKKKEEHPFWFWFGVVGTLISIITGGMYIAQYFGYLPVSDGNNPPPMSVNDCTATSTTQLSTILSKALTYDTVIERQDFLTKYIGDIVCGQGKINEISRFGNVLFIDIDFNPKDVNCNQDASDENIKRWLTAKGKQVEFVGKFPFSETPEHGLDIDECALTFL